MKRVRIGTRGSRLALWQAKWVANCLRTLYSDLTVELVPISTRGEKHPDLALSRLDDTGFFTGEIEDELRNGSIDIAVHSLKDLPTKLSEDLEIGAYCYREDPRDIFISKNGSRFEDLPENAQIGASSARRIAQILSLRPDLDCVDIRGNIDTRVQKLEKSEELSGIVMAAAGVIRLGMHNRITQFFSEEALVPAPGQGVIAAEISAERDDVRSLIASINHKLSEYEARAERTFLSVLEGEHQVPVAAHAVTQDNVLILRGMVSSLDGSRVIKVQTTGSDPELVGRNAAQDALKQGAAQIMEERRPDARAVRV